ncbi:MAG: hypothetical protein EXS05_22470 [Planctomycetaceae bacterium]|nr:hypothetical protein [Planctomycetaceae bacterium]
MIDQQISLPNLIPIALEQLEVDPLVDGGYYAGDLLAAILSVDEPFWTARPEMAFRVRAIVERVNALLCDRDEIELRSIRKVLTDGNRSLTE